MAELNLDLIPQESSAEYKEVQSQMINFLEFWQRRGPQKSYDLIKAEYDVNRKLFTTGGASLNDFYQSLVDNGACIELEPYGDELGWSPGILESHYWASWIEFDHFDTEMEDGMECTIISMRCAPVIDYAYY